VHAWRRLARESQCWALLCLAPLFISSNLFLTFFFSPRSMHIFSFPLPHGQAKLSAHVYSRLHVPSPLWPDHDVARPNYDYRAGKDMDDCCNPDGVSDGAK